MMTHKTPQEVIARAMLNTFQRDSIDRLQSLDIEARAVGNMVEVYDIEREEWRKLYTYAGVGDFIRNG